MTHRHLLPNEFDLLLDGEVGFGVAPLRAHVRSCARCRSELHALLEVATALEELPRFAPSPQFADAVLSQVQLFQPWHVAARDTLRALVPRTVPMRVLAGVGGAGVLAVFSLITMFVLVRPDLVLFSTGMFFSRARDSALRFGSDLVATLFGDATVAAISAEGGSAALMLLLLAMLAGTAIGLGALAAAARRQRIPR